MEKERIENLRQERIQKLLDEARAYRQAVEIREYVDQVLASTGGLSNQGQLDAWALWAKAQADDLDPIISGKFSIEGLSD